MAQFKPIKCTEIQMNSKAKSEGQLFFTIDTKKIFLDIDSETRIEFYGTEEEIFQYIRMTYTTTSNNTEEIFDINEDVDIRGNLLRTKLNAINVSYIQKLVLNGQGIKNIQNWYKMFCGNDYNYMSNCISNISDLKVQLSTNIINIEQTFYLCRNLKGTIPSFKIENCTSLNHTFAGCNNLAGTIPNFNTSNITTLASTFEYDSNLTGTIPNFNTSKVTNMQYTFSGCSNLTGTIPNFDTSNATTMIGMFSSCSNLTGSIPNFNTSKASSLARMFAGCNNLTNISNIVNMCINSKVTTYKNLSNQAGVSPLYNTKFNSSYFTTDEKNRLKNAGWTY